MAKAKTNCNGKRHGTAGQTHQKGEEMEEISVVSAGLALLGVEAALFGLVPFP